MTTATGANLRANRVMAFPRAEFASQRFDYKAGEHVVFGGPTQRGKTTLAFDMLEYVATPSLPAFVAVSKPRDPTTSKRGEELGFRRVDSWPPQKKLKDYFGEKPPGYLVWPKFGDVNRDIDNAANVTAKLINDRYAAGVRNKKGILILDDTMVKSVVMGLDRQMVTVLAMAGAMDLGLWAFVQKPTDSGRTAIWSYSQSEHLFLTRDPDANSVKRYGEIGGVDPKLVAAVLESLKPYEFLYLKRTGGFMAIVEKT